MRKKNSGTGKKDDWGGREVLVGEGDMGTFIYIDNFSNTENFILHYMHAHADHDQLPHHSAAQRRPQLHFCDAS